MKNIRVATLNLNLRDFFIYWIKLTILFHKLTVGEQSLISEILYQYQVHKKVIKDEDILWKIIFDYDTRLKIKEQLNIKDAKLQNLLTTLRKKEIIKDGRVIPSLIPKATDDIKNYKIIFNINIKDED